MSEVNIDALHMDIHPVLPKPIAVAVYMPSNELQNYLTNTECRQPPEFEDPMFGGVSTNTMILRDEICSDLRKKILYAGTEFARELMGIDTDQMIDVLSWVTTKRHNQRHQSHVHPNSVISGVYFFDDHTENLPLHFTNKLISEPSSDFILRPNYFPPSQITGKPDAPFSPGITSTVGVFKGTLVLFPSTLAHYVELNQTPFNRYSLAFNLLPREGLGNHLELTRFNYKDVL